MAANRNAPKSKRGIVLLLVISLLALFVLIGVTYALVAARYLDAAKTQTLLQQTGDLPEKEIDIVLAQILYDTAARSSLRGHSLLGDLYGQDHIYLANNGPSDTRILTVTGGMWGNQAFGFTVNGQALQPPQGSGPLSPILDYYTGRLLTFTEGPAKGYSGRILQYDPVLNPSAPQFVIELDYSSHRTFGAPLAENHFVINGAPFNGTGAGYSAANGNYQIDATYRIQGGTTDNLVALMPHFNGYDVAGGLSDNRPDLGGLDEAWDAVDFQNMLLAMMPPNMAQQFANSGAAPHIPSLHRPELVDYWRNRMTSFTEFSAGPLDASNNDPVIGAQTRNFLRTFIFRPMPWDHPNFSGSNASFDYPTIRQQVINSGTSSEPALSQEITRLLLDNLVNSSNLPIWDVDNDGDGYKDSIWIDPGLPMITTPDGKRVKRLACILIKDLDGRIDLNAHGNLYQTTTYGNANYRADEPAAGGLITTLQPIPRGIGFGPAEVDFRHLFSGDDTAYANVLLGRYSSNLLNDQGGSARPGIPNTRDAFSLIAHHGIPDYYQNYNNYGTGGWTAAGWYGSPPDVWGRGAIAIDHGGQPVTAYMGQNSEMVDAPYELALNGATGNSDSPYTLVELERLLRYHDADAQNLPCRPAQYASNYLAPGGAGPGVISASHTIRESVTTISSHLPVPGAPAPRPLNGLSGRNAGPQQTILDLYRERIMNGLGLSLPLSPAQEQQIAGEMHKIVAWEIRQGRKFNLNRWLGNGFDLNAAVNGVSDDPQEGASGQKQAWSNSTDPRFGPTASAPATFAGTIAQHSNGVDVDGIGGYTATDLTLARHLYARHLFCLAMLFLDNGFAPNCPHEATLNAANYRRLMIRRIAQWAVNVVDFRDSDAIMTAFEYDTNPWNGWNVDGVIRLPGDPSEGDNTSERDIVWGMEGPDLLITESLAFHDRRVKDTNQDPTQKKREEMSMADNDVDQLRIPQGSLFFELYCPRNRRIRNPRVPLDLYNPATGNLQLGKYVANNYPVWRLAISQITRGPNASLAVNSADTLSTTAPESASFDPVGESNIYGPTGTGPFGMSLLTNRTLPIERYVYFTNVGNAAGLESQGNIFFTSANPEVPPGHYAVVGPRTITRLGSKDGTAAGNPNWGGNSEARIEMTATGLTVYDANGGTIHQTPDTTKAPAVPIVVDTSLPGPGSPTPWTNLFWRVGLNITEPLTNSASYYPEVPDHGGMPQDAYDDPAAPDPTTRGFLDAPLDNDPSRPLGMYDMIRSGAYPNVATVFLQRLADPTQNYNVATNPYITVDWATIDVTVFTGEEDTDRRVMVMMNMEDVDPADPSSTTMARLANRFRTRERGRLQATLPTGNFWPPDTATPNTTAPDGGIPPEDYFKYSLATDKQTLGYLNQTVATPVNGAYPDTALGGPYLGDPDANNPAVPLPPWLAWHDRPFSNPLELLLVPSSSPSRICSEITPGSVVTASANPYDANDDEALRSPFAHLMNFFHSSPTASQSMELARLLDYVEVPSPYAGAEKWFNPSNFTTGGLYRPPFNKVSRFRDPGRININTIFSFDHFYAAVGGTPQAGYATLADFANDVFRSRQGNYGGNWYDTNNAYPTRFVNPYRAADAADLMPIANMRQTSPVNATLLRPDPSAGTKPMLQMNPGAGQWTENFRDIRRNPYFRYQAMQKLGNVFTTHSNCYAVWITMGYFEAEVAAVTAGTPDGYALGQEIGFDTGEVTRHRAFFLIDRSVPVGFIPGQKLNGMDCVLLRRFIE